VCSGCSPTNTAPTVSSTSVATGPDCAVHATAPSTIDGVFTDVPDFTVKQSCPVDVDPAFAGPQFDAQFSAVAAGDVAQDQLKSGQGNDFVHEFLSDLSTVAAPGKTVASEPKDIGGHQVTYFNIPADAEGYIYSKGPTVVIAYGTAGGSKGATAHDALTEILGNLH